MCALILLLKIRRVSDSRSTESEFHSLAPLWQKRFFRHSVLGSGNCREVEEPLRLQCVVFFLLEKRSARESGARPLTTLYICFAFEFVR